MKNNPFKEMSNNELVAYWNIMQYPAFHNADAANQRERHIPLVSDELTERGIPHQISKRTIVQKDATKTTHTLKG